MPLITQGSPKRARTGEKSLGRAAVPPKSPEVEYRLALIRMNRLIKQQTSVIGDLVKGGASPSFVSDRIGEMLRQANRRYNLESRAISGLAFSRMSQANKDKLERAMRLALGVDAATILDAPAVASVLDLTLAENTALIRSIPEQHFAKVSKAVLDNYRGEKFAEGSLANRLKKIGGITDRRAKFIARDQTAKFVSDINSARHIDLGIDSYTWRNAGDIKVTGAPGGPNDPSGSHGNHYVREGKVYRWDEPPADGHPGHAPGCRCWPEPVVDVEKVSADAIRA